MTHDIKAEEVRHHSVRNRSPPSVRLEIHGASARVAMLHGLFSMYPVFDYTIDQEPYHLSMKTFLTIVSGVAALAVIIVFAVLSTQLGSAPTGPSRLFPQTLPTFASCQDLSASLTKAVQAQEYSPKSGGIRFFDPSAPLGLGTSIAMPSEQASSFSETNVQVQGVDESDVVKTDGEYIYFLSNNSLTITKAYPAEDAERVSSTAFSSLRPREMFLYHDRLLILGERNVTQVDKKLPSQVKPISRSFSATSMQVWNIRDRKNPTLVRTVEFEGNFVTGRKIDDDVYVVLNTWGGSRETSAPVPLFREEKSAEQAAAEKNDFTQSVGCSSVAYFDPVQTDNFITIASLSLANDDSEVKKTVAIGSGENVYASLDNLYVAETIWSTSSPTPLRSLPSPITPPELDANKVETAIHQFSLRNNVVAYQGSGKAPGVILNQFSMDEYKNYFRIATTLGHVSRGGGNSTNNVYIFDTNMNRVGSLEDLAPGEKIYSARFMGDRGYLVTFKKVDPLFAIDLSSPRAPKVLGKLKIPGYSDYLQPYDETHLIGIGKDAIEAEGGDFALYQGVKMALFDVTDATNPKQLYATVIGDRGTDSPVLTDHKALLFDRERNLFVIPIQLAEIDEEAKRQSLSSMGALAYVNYTFQGAYVYRLTLENGFELRGRITHTDPDAFAKLGDYYPSNSDDTIQRSLFIDDALYTISNQNIAANRLSDLTEIKRVELYSDAERGERQELF